MAWGQGEAETLDQLVPLVRDELRRLVRRYMGHERRGHTLQATERDRRLAKGWLLRELRGTGLDDA